MQGSVDHPKSDGAVARSNPCYIAGMPAKPSPNTDHAMTVLADSAIVLETSIVAGFFGSLGYITLAAVGVI